MTKTEITNTKSNVKPIYLTPPEAEAYLLSRGITRSLQTLANWRMNGIGPKYAILGGCSIFYTQQWLDEWIEAEMKEIV